MRAVTFHISVPKWVVCKALGRFWRGVFWSRLSTLGLRDMPDLPLPGDDWVRMRPRLGGICGSDVELVTLGSPPDYFGRGLIIEPIVVGHENVSEVVERGPDAGGVEGGVRYNVDPIVACRARGLELCRSCRAGQFSACWNVAEAEPHLGFSVGHSAPLGGSWADAFVAHKSQLVPVPPELSDEQAVLVDPLSSSVHTVLRRPPTAEDQDVLVFGCGLIGLGIIEFLRAWGFKGRVLATARHPFQKALALGFGADECWDRADLARQNLIRRIADLYGLPPVKGTAGKPLVLGGVDLVYDAVGVRASVEDALRVTRPQGTVVIVGMGHPRWVDWDPLPHKQLTVVGVHGRGLEDWKGGRVHTYRIVHELMAAGRFPAGKLLTHVFALDDYRRAMEVLTHKGPHAAVHGAFRVET